MKIIYKWSLNPFEKTIIDMDDSFEILTIQKQGNEIVLWAFGKLNSKPPESQCKQPQRVIHRYGTGNPIDPKDTNFDNLRFINTVQDDGYVWHFFEELK